MIIIAAKSQCNKIHIGLSKTNAAGSIPVDVIFAIKKPVPLYSNVFVTDGVCAVMSTPEPASKKQQKIPGITYIDLTSVILFDLIGIGVLIENTNVKSVGYAMTA